MPAPIDIAGSLAYLVVGSTCLWTARHAGGRGPWLGLAGFFALLAAARLADLEGWSRAVLRSVWTANRDYDARTGAQLAAMTVLVVLALIALAGTGRLARRDIVLAAAVSGACGLIGLAALRIVSWHGTDRLLYAGTGPLRMHILLELACLGIVMWGASKARTQGSPRA